MIKNAIKSTATMIPANPCIPQVTIIVIRYLHQLFLPDSALYKNGIFDIIIPPLALVLEYNYLYLIINNIHSCNLT